MSNKDLVIFALFCNVILAGVIGAAVGVAIVKHTYVGLFFEVFPAFAIFYNCKTILSKVNG